MLKDKMKALIAKSEEGDNKKKVENLVAFLVILIVTLVAINLIWGGNKTSKKEETTDPNKKLAITNQISETSSEGEQENLSVQLENILSNIEGVGRVKVLITYSETSQTVPMYNEETSQKDTEEKDTNRWNKKSA